MGLSRTLGWWSYQALLSASLVATAPALALRRGGTGLAHYLPTLRGRLALDLEEPAEAFDDGQRLWVHAVSVGEVNVAATLIRHLPAEIPLVVTTVTPTGQALAKRLFAKRGAVAYLPFDLGTPVDRFLEHYDPAMLILVEGDYWPLALERARRRGALVAVANGRLSDRAFRRQRRLGRINDLFYAGVDCFGVQTDDDRRRLVALGARQEQVHVCGNLKFDAPEPTRKPALAGLLERIAQARPILVAGSTMEGEEEQVLDAFRRLGGGERALLVLAPRHPERWDRVASLLSASDSTTVRRSVFGESDFGESDFGESDFGESDFGESDFGENGGRHQRNDSTEPPTIDIVLLDSLGELASVYGLATAAFIGGTLVPTGGHNPLEPALFGVPTAVGPSMHNFREIAEAFDHAEAWGRSDDAEGLARLWKSWLEQPEKAQAVGEAARSLLEENRGASQRTVELLTPLLRHARLLEPTPTTAEASAGIES